MKTPTPKYAETSDVDKVLEHIPSLGEDNKLTDKELTHKLTMLLALTSASRASEIQGLHLSFMKDNGTEIEFTIHKLIKTRKTGEKPMVVSFQQYAKSNLDVVGCLRAYIRRTAPWRMGSKREQLLLGIPEPHNPVYTSTISNWLKRVLEAAGIDTQLFQGHSTRSAATSKANMMGMSVLDIMKAAN